MSVVIPAFNAERFLRRAVESVFATDYPDVEVVIVNDGSTDGTARLAEALCNEYAPKCRLLGHPDGGNHGVGASRNLGVEAGDSEWVAFLDADDFYLPNRFDALRSISTADGPVDAVYEIAEVRSDSIGQAPAPAAANGRFGIDRDLGRNALLEELLRGVCWATSAITLRRTVLRRTGLFDPEKKIAEDCDLWFRIAAIGQVVAGSLVQPVSVYWRHASNTYSYRIEHRVPMVRAMLDAWNWARRKQAPADALAVFATAVPDYVTRSIVAARDAGRPDVAWRLLGLMVGARKPGYPLRWTVLRQVLALIRETWLGKSHARGEPQTDNMLDSRRAGKE